MEGMDVLLGAVLDRHKAHRRPGDGFSNPFRICHIVLVGLDIGFDKLGCHQIHAVPMFTEAPHPIMHAPQASIPITTGDNWAIKGMSAPLGKRFRKTMVPVPFMPTTWNICLAMSIPNTPRSFSFGLASYGRMISPGAEITLALGSRFVKVAGPLH